MKKISLYQAVIFIGLVFTSSIPLIAQAKMTSETRYIIKSIANEYKISKGISDNWNSLVKTYPLNKNSNGYSLSFLAKKNIQFNEIEFTNKGIEIGSQIGNIITLRVPATSLMELFTIPGLDYLEVAGKASPDLDKVLFDTRVDSVHQAINLPEAYTGKDILIGVTDWGFDYTSPMFYDTLLTQTRIYAAWDQFKTSGPAPVGYSYGTEFEGDANLLLAQTDTTDRKSVV